MKLASFVMRKQNALWNALVSVDNDYKDARRQALKDGDPEYDLLTKCSDAELKLLSELYEREKVLPGPEVKRDIGDAKERLKVFNQGIKEGLLRAKIAAKPLLEQCELDRRAAVSSACKSSGLWWSHSETVLAAFDIARVAAIKSGKPLRFRRFNGDGSFGIRFPAPDPLNLSKVLSGSTSMVSIRQATEQELGRSLALKSDGGRRVVVCLRVGEKKNGVTPPTLQFLVNMHAGMDFPQDIPLKTVTAQAAFHVNKTEWNMKFMFSKKTEQDIAGPELLPTAVGVDFGVRMVEEDGCDVLRVGAISDGEDVQYVTLDSEWIERMERADTLHEKLHATAREFSAKLKAMLEGFDIDQLPESDRFRIVVKKMLRARGAFANILMDVCRAHASSSTPLGAEADDVMQRWLSETTKLSLEAHHCRRKALDHRKHVYRNIAAKLVLSAGLIGLRDGRLDDEEESNNGSDSGERNLLRKIRGWAAPSELRSAIENAAKREKCELVKVSGDEFACHSCGHVHTQSEHLFACHGCKKIFDIGANSAINIRKAALSRESVAS